MYECNPQRVGFNALCEIIRNVHCLLSQTQLVKGAIYISELRYEGFCLLSGIEISTERSTKPIPQCCYILIDFSLFKGVLLALKNNDCNVTGDLMILF